MSINHRFAVNEKKVKRYGKLYHSIDFELNDNLTNEEIKNNQYEPIVGKFLIGDKVFSVTCSELKYIMETAYTAHEIYLKSYKLGMYR